MHACRGRGGERVGGWRRRESGSSWTSLNTHLCPGGSANSPSPVAPFPRGVVVRAAPALRLHGPSPPTHLFFNPSQASPESTPKIQNTPSLTKKKKKRIRERSGVRLFWEHRRTLGEGVKMGRPTEEKQGWRERREEEGRRGLLMVESPICGTCVPLPFCSPALDK